ncbi:MAG: L,D-transpeptidase [Thermomicrobiaceae bacterium]
MKRILALFITFMFVAGTTLPALAAESSFEGADSTAEGPCVLESVPEMASQAEVGPDQVYFPQTGHHLGDDFLDYWRSNGGLYQFGYPLTEEISEGNLTVQYFERAVFEFHADNAPEWQVLLRRLGADGTKDLRDEPPFQRVSASDNDDTRFFEATGHRLSFGFKTYWERNGELRVFGYPISEEFTEDGRTVQYFERARFEWHPEHRGTQYEILLGHLGRQDAGAGGVDTSPVDRISGIEDYHPNLWYVPAPPPPTPPAIQPPTGAPTYASKWIEVDLTNQLVRAWEYDSMVYSTLASTGRAATPTLTGTFRTYLHLRYGDMSGWTPDQGSYYVPDVPYIMYYDGGYGIHGAYWHNNFGTPMSAGCVNLPVGDAGWMYNWAPVGTTVYIHR